MSNSYTFQILDPNDLVSAAIEASITIDAQYVIGLVSRYISWKGTMDFVVEIRPASELTWSDADGLLPSFVQIGWTGSAWTNQTLTEARTGFDPNPNRPDAGLTIYLADDGTIKNYGAPVWFDPNPGFEVNPAIPAGMHDFVSILTHEIFHSLGFISYTQEWAARMVSAGDISYFTGAQSGALYGGAIPFRTGSDHYGYAQDPSIPIGRGLMYEFGNYQQNRWEIGRIDLAMLADLGYTIKTYDGLSLFELLDSATNLTGTGAGEALYGDYHSNVLAGLGGNDRIEAGSGNDQLSGGDGNDLLRGGAGVDSFDGGSNLTADDPVTYYGDRISFAEPTATQGAVADLRTGTILNDGFGNTESMTGIESLGGGTAFADTLNGDDNRNALLGGPGDTLNGHGGDDVIRITAAPASAHGGSGTDLLDLTSNGGFYLPDSNGDGLAEIGVPMPGSWTVDLDSGLVADGYGNRGAVAGFENISGSAASDLLGGDGNANLLKGNGGADILFGAGGGDTLEGGDGNDEIDGGDGDDMLRGEAGDDQLYVDGIGTDQAQGGTGTDTLIVDYGDSVLAISTTPFADPNGGHSGFISDGSTRTVNYSGIENFNITTGSGNDVVRAGANDNIVSLGAGDDQYIFAGASHWADGGAGIDGIRGDYSAGSGTILWNLVTGEFSGTTGSFVNFEYFASLVMGSGNNTITTANLNLNDSLVLGGGNDSATLWNGHDTVHGGVASPGAANSGFDTLVLNYSQSTNGVHNVGMFWSDGAGYSGEFGDDATRLATFHAIDRFLIATGSGADDIRTGDGDDEIRTGGGNDVLNGGGGNDLLDGGHGDDRLVGGAGDDSYSGGDGTDTLDFSGEAGPVVVNLSSNSFFSPAGHPFGIRSVGPGEALDSFGNYEAVSGIENLILTTGNDRVLGGEGANRIEGRAGDDLLIGAGGDDILDGGDGHDTIDGGAGSDTMTGGTGNDIYTVENAGDSVVENAGEGTDEIRTPLASYSLLGSNIENLRALSNVAHDFRGNGANNVITGGSGNDILRLQDGGDDTAIGGAGNDGIMFGAVLSAGDVVDGGEGNRDQLGLQGNYGTFGAGASAFTLGTNHLVNIEMLVLLSGADSRFGDTAGNSYSYNIATRDVNVAAGQQFVVSFNTLRVGENVTFDGSAETDGSFMTYGGLGTDILTGGQQSDSFYFGADGRFGTGDRVDGQGGSLDQLGLQGDYSGARAVTFASDSMTSIEMIVLLSAGDSRFGGGSGDGFSYDIVMNDSNVAEGARMYISANALRSDGTLTEILNFDGSAEKDGFFTIYAGSGADTLVGGERADEIWGRGGSDRITGGLGADILRGGEGDDVFDYNSAAESTAACRDSILDFTSGSDRIDLSGIDADSLTAGDQAFSFIGSNAFSGNGAAGQLRVYEDGANWIVEGDVNGDGVADFQIGVVRNSSGPLTGSDFIV